MIDMSNDTKVASIMKIGHNKNAKCVTITSHLEKSIMDLNCFNAYLYIDLRGAVMRLIRTLIMLTKATLRTLKKARLSKIYRYVSQTL